MAQIEIRLNNLLAQVELETGKRPTYAEINEATGIAESTLSRFAKGKTTRFDSDILTSLVDYFDANLESAVTLADLIAYPPALSQEMFAELA